MGRILKIKNYRWYVVAMLFAATAISYIDRQNLSVLAPLIRDELEISNSGYAQIVSAFLLAYTVMQAVTGWFIDKVGTRRGFAIIMAWWSLAAILHAFSEGVISLSIYRFFLGAGEAGSWAACVKSVSEWFPKAERGKANALWGVGSSAGLVVSVPLVAWLALMFGWQYSFLVTGALGFIWLAFWLKFYDLPEDHVALTKAELIYIKGERQDIKEPTSLTKRHYVTLFRSRNVWSIILSRFLADPCVWFYYAWIPEFLKRTAGFSLTDIAKYAWIPFFAGGVGIIIGGYMSDRLYNGGMKVVSARFIVMFIGMSCMSLGVLAGFEVNIYVTFFAMSMATFGFGLWAPNMMTLCGETFPPNVVGSVTGLGGMGAGLGAIGFTMFTGWMLDNFGYLPIFVAAGVLPILAVTILYTLFDQELAEEISQGKRVSLFGS